MSTLTLRHKLLPEICPKLQIICSPLTEKMNNAPDHSFADQLITDMKQTIIDLEQARVQAALGKAEARDTFESSRKKLQKHLHDARQFIGMSEKQVDAAIDTMEVYLALGKAEAHDKFIDQKNKIMHGIHVVEAFLRNKKSQEEKRNAD
jgi:hypothetical protein